MILKGTQAFFNLPALETVSSGEPRQVNTIESPGLTPAPKTAKQGSIRMALSELVDALHFSAARSKPSEQSCGRKRRGSRRCPDSSQDVQPLLKMIFNDQSEEYTGDVFALSYDAELRRLVAKNLSNNVIVPAELRNSSK